MLPPRVARLAERLTRPLPARAAHQRLWPAHLPLRPLDEFEPDYRQAAVLLLLFAKGDGVRVPLIQRPHDMEHHAGQVALPGGERENGESLEECALREAREEVGLLAPVAILGRLSPIPIQVSRYRVDPIVGWCEGEPSFTLAGDEVVGLLLADPDELARRGPTLTVERSRDGLTMPVPAYDVGGAAVWGATGFILAEFTAIWDEVR